MSARARRGAALPRIGPAAGAASALVVVVAVFLPWYTTNLGEPFSPTSISGWDATDFAKGALAAAAVAAVASGALALEERGALALEERHGEALAWIVLAAAGVALILVGYRLLFMPDPADLLSRQVGLYLAAAAAVVAVLSGLGLLATRR